MVAKGMEFTPGVGTVAGDFAEVVNFISNQWFQEGPIHVRTIDMLKGDSLDEIVKALQEKGYHERITLKRNFDSLEHQNLPDIREIILLNEVEDTVCSFRTSRHYETMILEGGVVSKDSKEADDFISLVKPFRKPDEEVKAKDNNVYMLLATAHGIQFSPIGQVDSPFQKGNYLPEASAEFEKISKSFSAKDPLGRLVILDGVPGSGKTHFVRGLFTEVENARFYLINADAVASISSPNFLPALLQEREQHHGKKTSIFVLEDADTSLVSRGSDNISNISALLNLCDGILGSLLDIRVIATTNAKRVDIDKALTRKGRLLSHLSFGALPVDQANARYAEIGKLPEGSTFTSTPATLAQIYAAALGDNTPDEDSGKGHIRLG